MGSRKTVKSSSSTPHSSKAGGHDNRHSLFLYGQHAVYAALTNPARTLKCLWHEKPLQGQIEQIVKQRKVPHQQVDKQELLNRVGHDSLHQGLVLETSPLVETALEDYLSDWQEQPRATLVLLDQIADERNLGAIMRSALCLGADAVLCTDRHSARESGHVAKTASGAWEALPCVRVGNLSRTIVQLQENGFWCFAFSGDGDQPLSKLNWPTHVAMVFGSEGQGVRRLNLENCDATVSLPHNPSAHLFGLDSLNLAQSIAIALYARQVGYKF